MILNYWNIDSHYCLLVFYFSKRYENDNKENVTLDTAEVLSLKS